MKMNEDSTYYLQKNLKSIEYSMKMNEDSTYYLQKA